MNNIQIMEYIKNGEITTPSYVLDMDVLISHVNTMKTVIGNSADLCYAMKANPFLVPVMAELVNKIEVCSLGELSICKAYNIPGSKIVFSGVNKTWKDVEEALDYEVAVITVESVKQFRLIYEYCKNNFSRARVLFRLTNNSQFGMEVYEIESILAKKEIYKHIDVVGIHYFSGTQKKKFDKIKEELEALDRFISYLQETYELSDMTLEYGAGLAVPYFEGEDFEGIYQSLEMMIEKINAKKREYKVVLELGRFFAFSCGTYFTRVEDVKCNNGTNYVLVDGGIHHLNYYGQNMAMRVPKMELFSMTDMEHTCCEDVVDVTICGSLCTLADILVRKWNGRLPVENDFFAFYNAGSYSITEAPALFLSRKMPAIYLYSEVNGLKMIREVQEAYKVNLSDCKSN